MATEIVIRPATRADLPGILAIYNDAVLHTTATYDEEPSTLEARSAWFETRTRQGMPVLVAERAGAIAGWGSFGPYNPRSGYRYTVEHSIYVDAAQRGRGIGRRLLGLLIAAARERGMHALLAGIDAENDVSRRLHAAFGFVEVGRLREVGFKFGRWLDVVFLELLL